MDYNELKQLIESKNFEVREIANQLKMTPNGFRESIRNETIQLKKLRILADILNISPNQIFDSQKGVYLNNVHAQVGNNNKMVLENKDKEISMLKETLADKNEIIRMLRERMDMGIAASPKNNTYQTKK